MVIGVKRHLYSISVISLQPVHISMLFWISFDQYSAHWLLSYITIVETADSSVRGMNPVAMTTINLRKEYWPSQDQTGDLLFSSPQCYRLTYRQLSVYLKNPNSAQLEMCLFTEYK